MAVAFKGSTIAIFILCVVTVVSLVFWGFDRIKTPDEDNVMPSLNAASFVNPNFGKKDYVSALSEAIRHVRQDVNLIHQRFEMDYEPWQEFYMMIWNMPEHAWDIIRYKFAVKILKGFLQEQPPTFTMLFTGTSVTAGHESFYTRSYVGIIEERMKKTLRAAGINTIVRNMAQPAFGCHVNNYCFPSLGINPDEEIDFMSWENTFNCGGENAPVLEYFARVAAQHKAVAFYSASGGASLGNCAASRDPVPYIAYDWTPEVAGITHTYSPSMAKVSEYKKRMVNRFRNGPAADKLVRLSQRPYKGTGPHGMSMFSRTRQECNATNILNPAYMPIKPKKTPVVKPVVEETEQAAERRQLAVEKDIDPSSITMPLVPPTKASKAAKGAQGGRAAAKAASAAKAAPAPAASNKKANASAVPPPPNRNVYCMTNDLWAQMCHDQGGPKIATREFSFKGNDPGVVQGRASYNPSAGLHILRAELFLYNYYHILLDAIFNLQKDLSLIAPKHHSDPTAMFKNQLEMYERKLLSLQRTLTEPLSEPKHCAAWECGNPMENTQCFTEYQPNYLPARSTAAAANILKTHGFAASTDHSLTSVIVGNVTKDGWVRVEKNVLSARQFGNKDRQMYYYSEDFGARLPLLISLPHGKTTPLARNAKEAETWTNENQGIVKIYHASEKATLENAEFYLETSVVASEDQMPGFLKRYSDRVYTAASSKTPVKLVKDLHYVYQKGHVHFYGLPQGIHVLIVQTPSESSAKLLAQKVNAQYAKQFKEQMEDIDIVKPATKAKKPVVEAISAAAADEQRRRLAKNDDEVEEQPAKKSKAAVASILKPTTAKTATAAKEAAVPKEEKKKGPKVIEPESLAKVSVGQLVLF